MQDADSLDPNTHKKSEGFFYVWSHEVSWQHFLHAAENIDNTCKLLASIVGVVVLLHGQLLLDEAYHHLEVTSILGMAAPTYAC